MERLCFINEKKKKKAEKGTCPRPHSQAVAELGADLIPLNQELQEDTDTLSTKLCDVRTKREDSIFINSQTLMTSKMVKSYFQRSFNLKAFVFLQDVF